MKKIVIPSILTLLLFIVPSCKYFNRVSKKEALAIEQRRIDSIRVADSIKSVQERLLAMEQARQDSIRLVEERLAHERSFRYNIIVGSFITPEYATNYAAEFRDMGYDPKIIGMTGTPFNLVAAERFQNFNQAVSRLKQFQDTVSFDAWLYISN
ncbi:MAG: SPOR domain-containing protein [Bacteroidales bacterium]|jgi:hypothetical protein